LAGVEVDVTVSAAGATEAVNEGTELCAVARTAQARERTNDLDIFTRLAEYQKGGDGMKHDLSWLHTYGMGSF
jgi:hypothetical protein